MLNIIDIDDLNSPELAAYTQLTEAQLRKRLEPEKGIFIAESAKVIKLALDEGYKPLSFLMERRHISGQAKDILSRCEDIPVYTADSSLLAELTGYQLNRGILCALRRPCLPDVELLCRDAHRLAVLENITDATNVGAIFRSAAALGVDALLVTPSCSDPLNRRSVRVSMGAVLKVPWTYICESPRDWPLPSIERPRSHGFKLIALALGDDSIPIDDPGLSSEDRLALVFGTEGKGLEPATIAACDYSVCIPMFRGMDSLNVAAASAIAFWQLRRLP